MIRISTIFIAICMVLVAASLGLTLYSVAGISGSESAIVALTALTFLILYNAVSMRLRDRTDVGSQITDLSRGTADLARQVAEFGRRLAAIETKMVSASSVGSERIQSVVGEINELGGLVRQLAISVASHDDTLSANAAAISAALGDPVRPTPKENAQPTSPQPPVRETPSFATPSLDTATPAMAATAKSAESVAGTPIGSMAEIASARSQSQILAVVKSAVEDNRLDIYLQPMVTLPQRKVRFYEAMTRLRDNDDQLLTAEDFIGPAEAAGLIGRIDHMVMLRCVQVLRRLMVRNKDVGVFCNIAAATLGNPTTFSQCLDFLEANRALATSFVLEFKQATFRHLGPIETEHLAALAQRGYRFSIDNVTDLRIEPRELADRGVRYIKVPAALLLDPKQTSTSDIHPSDLSDLLGRFGIDLIAERIEGERSVVDLLDYDVRFGQGFLFAPPRPLRPEAASATAGAPATADASAAGGASATRAEAQGPHDTSNDSGKTSSVEGLAIDPPRISGDTNRITGNAALARRVAGP